MLQKKYLIHAFLICAIVGGCVSELRAATAEEQFYQAEISYKKFLKDEKQVRYRDNWLACIRKFQGAYKKSPSGPLAPASLYMAGTLYENLYIRSGKSDDRREALATFRQVIRRFPESQYRVKARKGLDRLSGDKKTEDASAPVHHVRKKSFSKTASRTPQQKTPVRLKRRGALFKKSKAGYKKSARHKASQDIASLIAGEQTPAAPVTSPARAARVDGLRVWSNPNYTRVVVDLSRETRYTHRLLDRDRASKKPQRLYIDFTGSRLGRQMNKIVPINDDLLSGARAGQRTPSSVRVVIDLKSFKTYKIFSLKNPFRTIIDVWGSEAGHTRVARSGPAVRPRTTPAPAPSVMQAAIREEPEVSPHDLARQLALGVRRIVIDPGHGGHDGGAPGYLKGVNEKDIVLRISTRLARKIRKELGCEVIMTRKTDRYLTLEERTAIANTRNADLFISIHCNADKRRKGYGIETYFLNLATDAHAIRVAARENATSRKNISDLQTILNDLMKNAKINESSRLAGYVQKETVGYMKKRYSKIRNKGVKQAPFYVLIGAQMPSILVETSFISHKRECQRLTSGAYQEHLCNGIIRGIRKYIQETNPTAFLKEKSSGRG
ncbi:N-acetylmuramoyl-L-alanine amidase [Desulfonema ishimotonii]|uniref:N-acetylmuramoyl-L-alanine amidase n=1 Tax=Desulfonema ishimotonii TaxID=45657 RepID=A0A401FTU2_9BACT|nr:N-acetylmuramoyl-L-alanine amidase [Desulfonema ishimotonii]GBC60389.1 N-acetylmuramoyl-L-alanine amidase [Desulfonema ishimotonii]